MGRHVFCVHSHTSFYTSLAVIDYLNIEKEEVVFLIDRMYTNKYFDFNYVDFSLISKEISPISIKKIFFLKKTQDKIDEILIKQLENELFVAYIPQVMHPLYQMIITHVNCTKYNFIEEGLVNYIDQSYSVKNYKKFFYKIPLKAYNLLSKRLELGHSFLGKFNKANLFNYEPIYYYLNTNFHTSRNDVCFLKWKKHKIDFFLEEMNTGILVVSPTYEYGLGTLDQVKKNIELQLNFLISKRENIYIKFHPYNGEIIKNYIDQLKNDLGVRLNEIEGEEPLEQIFVNYNDLLIVGLDSSLLFYAKILNDSHKSVSFYKKLLDNDEVYKSKCGIIPIKDVFDNVVESNIIND